MKAKGNEFVEVGEMDMSDSVVMTVSHLVDEKGKKLGAVIGKKYRNAKGDLARGSGAPMIPEGKVAEVAAFLAENL